MSFLRNQSTFIPNFNEIHGVFYINKMNHGNVCTRIISVAPNWIILFPMCSSLLEEGLYRKLKNKPIFLSATVYFPWETEADIITRTSFSDI